MFTEYPSAGWWILARQAQRSKYLLQGREEFMPRDLARPAWKHTAADAEPHQLRAKGFSTWITLPPYFWDQLLLLLPNAKSTPPSITKEGIVAAPNPLPTHTPWACRLPRGGSVGDLSQG